MKISEIAKKTGLSASTIRFYERTGVLVAAERRTNGYRTYSAMDEQRLHMICIAQNLGFSLAGIKAFLRARPVVADGGLLALIDGRLSEIDRMAEILRTQRQDIVKMRETMMSCWQTGACLTAESLYVDMSTPMTPSPKNARERTLHDERRQGPRIVTGRPK